MNPSNNTILNELKTAELSCKKSTELSCKKIRKILRNVLKGLLTGVISPLWWSVQNPKMGPKTWSTQDLILIRRDPNKQLVSHVIAIDHAKYLRQKFSISNEEESTGLPQVSRKKSSQNSGFSIGFQPFSHFFAWNGDVFPAFPIFTRPEKTRST